METSQSLNEVPIYKGFLYRISDSTGKERGHLAGSVHATGDANYTLHPSMEAACQKAASIIVEVNFLTDPKMKLRVHKEHPNEGIDLKILRMAFLARKGIHQLETFEFQKNLLETEIFPSEEEKNIGETIMRSLTLKDHEIQELDLPEADRIRLLAEKDSLEKMSKGYKSGKKSDLKPLLMINNETLQKSLFWDRNLKIAGKIDGFLQQQVPLFILIGTGHLWGRKEEGKKGVVALLRDKGWNVEKVKYNAI